MKTHLIITVLFLSTLLLSCGQNNQEKAAQEKFIADSTVQPKQKEMLPESSEHAEKTDTSAGNVAVSETINPLMIKVEGGSFQMGDELNLGNKYELPVHQVILKSFSIAQTETTVLQWKMYCKATGNKMPEPPAWGWKDSYPIVNVNWDDATAYCKWLSNRTGKKFRLPTEAEWEYAARGGNMSKGFKFSGDHSIDVVGWDTDNSRESAHRVAQKAANELGIYDMSGNVWEWCSDWFDDDYYHESPAENPQGPPGGTNRVIRGGSWEDFAPGCRVANRGRYVPNDRSDIVGIRLVQD